MADYAKMYALLCSAMSEAIDMLEVTPANQQAIDSMVDALEAAEEIYIRSADEKSLGLGQLQTDDPRRR